MSGRSSPVRQGASAVGVPRRMSARNFHAPRAVGENGSQRRSLFSRSSDALDGIDASANEDKNDVENPPFIAYQDTVCNDDSRDGLDVNDPNQLSRHSSYDASSNAEMDDDGGTTFESDSVTRLKRVYGLFPEERTGRCLAGHIEIASYKPRSSGLSCDVCAVYTGSHTLFCAHCRINYCLSCDAIRKLSLRQLLLHPTCLKEHGHKPLIDDQMVAYGVEMNEPDDEGDLPLHLAIKNEIPTRVLQIVVCANPGAAVIRDPSGYLPLHLALMFQCDTKIVRLLLDYHFNAVLERDPEGAHPIHLALKHGANAETVALLAGKLTPVVAPLGNRRKGKVRMRSLEWVDCLVVGFDMKIKKFEILVPSGSRFLVGDPNVRVETSVLHYAVRRHVSLAVLEVLLSKHPSLPFIRDADGDLALHAAVECSAPSELVCTLLIANPKSGGALNKDGHAPMRVYMQRVAEREAEGAQQERLAPKGYKNASAHSWGAFVLDAVRGVESIHQLSVRFRNALIVNRKLNLGDIRANKDPISTEFTTARSSAPQKPQKPPKPPLRIPTKPERPKPLSKE